MFLLFASFAFSGRFALLFAGSNGWKNYRHQADICTMYTKLIERGYDESEIFICCYDDLAYYPRSPYQGQIFHTREHDVNVYPGQDKLNLRGADVSAEGFYQAINDIPTTKDDYLFIFYSNHGGPGILGVPDGCGEEIMPDELDAALNKINGKFKKALFGIEACYAGSVAELFTAKDIGTITASNNQESSYAANYDSEFGTYLTNDFTLNWFDQMDIAPAGSTIGYLYKRLQDETTSHASYYGDEEVKELKMDVFLGTQDRVGRKMVIRKGKEDVVPQRMATLVSLEALKVHGKDDGERKAARLELVKMQARSEKLEIVLDKLILAVDASNGSDVRIATPIRCDSGYMKALRTFLKRFGKVNPDDYGRFMIIKNLCAKFGYEKVIAAIEKTVK